MKPFEIQIDHENLKYFKEPHKLNGQQARWYLKLQDYDFILQHIPGKTNTKVDILSRKDQVDTKEDNKDIQLLKKELWKRRTMVGIMMLKQSSILEKTGLMKEIQRNRTKKKKVIQELQKEDRQAWRSNRIVYINK